MTQKTVSFEIATALKDAGYPQDNDCNTRMYDINGIICLKYIPGIHYCCVAPTYLNAWLWLWREKKICINCNLDKYNLIPQWWCNNEDGINYNTPNFNDPEEAIISAIEYLVKNDLIK